jgi:glycosyltransferase involved in cell wall biosynthesis
MSRLRILVVHNRYQLAGGEDAVVDAEIALLRRNGHAVEAYLRDNHELRDMNPFNALAQSVWSRRTGADLAQIARVFQPDVIHAHNTFALVSPSVYWQASRMGVPVVQTLHNFRLLCVQAMFLHENQVCEDCLGHVPWRGVVRKCYRDSALQSAAAAAVLGTHRALGTYRHKVTRYIALNEFCRRKFIEGGLPASRIAVKPNFVDIARPQARVRSGGLYVGRLAAEKGTEVLIGAVRKLPGVTLDVIGAGPESLKLEAHPQLNPLGWLQAEDIYERMRRAAYLVMPSLWYENFPRTLLEAFANGLPVIASRLGALRELIEHGRTGLLFEAGSSEDLARHLAWAEAFPEKMRAMGENARAVYEARFTSRENYGRLIAIYEDALAAVRLKVAV